MERRPSLLRAARARCFQRALETPARPTPTHRRQVSSPLVSVLAHEPRRLIGRRQVESLDAAPERRRLKGLRAHGCLENMQELALKGTMIPCGTFTKGVREFA